MLATLLTGLFLAVQALGELGRRLSPEEPPPYLVHQPLPWQLHSVTQSRRSSRDSGKGGSSRRGSLHSAIAGRRGNAGTESAEATDPAEKAAVTIQAHYHKYRQHKHRE